MSVCPPWSPVQGYLIVVSYFKVILKAKKQTKWYKHGCYRKSSDKMSTRHLGVLFKNTQCIFMRPTIPAPHIKMLLTPVRIAASSSASPLRG